MEEIKNIILNEVKEYIKENSKYYNDINIKTIISDKPLQINDKIDSTIIFNEKEIKIDKIFYLSFLIKNEYLNNNKIMYQYIDIFKESLKRKFDETIEKYMEDNNCNIEDILFVKINDINIDINDNDNDNKQVIVYQLFGIDNN